MKVLLIDVVCKYGSTGKIVYDLYSQINASGDEAAICYGRGPKLKEKNIFKFSFDFETLLHAFLTRITGFTGCFSYFSTRRLIKFIKKFKPDVVHIHELHAYFLNVVPLLKFLKKQNIKVVHTLHCAYSYTGKCGHHFECEKWKTECGKCPRLHEYISTSFFDRTKRMFNSKKKAFTGFKDFTVVSPSKWLGDFAKQSFLGQYPIKIIPNGIDCSIFYPRETNELRKKFNINKDEKVVLAVAPNLMSSAKGGKLVMEIADKMKDENVKFVMVGLNDINIEHSSNVILFERTNNQDQLAEFYSLADAFVICSDKENFPTTCIEAQCCGTPVCGFDVGGTKETSILDKNTFVEYGKIDNLIEIIRNILGENYKQKFEIAKEAKKMFDKHNFFERYLELYRGENE